MFKISIAKPDELPEIKLFLEEHGQPFEMDKLYMVSRENGFAGLGIFSILDDYAVIDNIFLQNEQDTDMIIFIIQALVNKIDLMGYKTVYCNQQRLQPYLAKFTQSNRSDYKYMADLTKYFEHSCHNALKNN